jgi:hypothetical protein
VVAAAGGGAVLFDVALLARAAGPVLHAAAEATRQAITAADVAGEGVRWVVCVGGGARMPVVADALAAGLGVRPLLVTHAEHAAVFGAVQAPLRSSGPGPVRRGGVGEVVDAVTAVVAAVGSVGLFAQFVAGAQRYGPRQSIVPGMLLAYWGGLAMAAVLAVVAGAAGAGWLGVWWPAPAGGDRLGRRWFGVLLAGGAVAGLGAAGGYAAVGVGYFDVPPGPLLRWSVVAALPVAVAVLAAAALVVWRADPPVGAWSGWFRLPTATVVLAVVGAVLLGYDVSGAPAVLAPLRWWLEQRSAATGEIVGVLGRLGGACLGVGVGLLLAGRWWQRLLVAVPLAGLMMVATTWRSTGLIAVGFAVVVAGWWLSRVVAALTYAVLHPPPAGPAAGAAGERTGDAVPGPGPVPGWPGDGR